MAVIVRDREAVDDLTQRFFETVVLSGRLLTRADRHKGQFRPYLKQAIRNFLVDERRRAARHERAEVRPDADEAGWQAVAAEASSAPEEEMLRAWARSLIGIAMTKLRGVCDENGQGEHFELFARRYLTDADAPPSWRDLGARFGLDEKIARSRAETAARHFRILLRELIASDLGSNATVDQELRGVIALL